MSKSYRKPYGTWVRIKTSAHSDKTFAARAVRRAQEQALREAIRDDEWEGWLIPDRYECSSNDVWDWARDGHKRLMHPGSQYNNPYAYNSYCSAKTEQEYMVRWFERMQHDDEFMADASRK